MATAPLGTTPGSIVPLPPTASILQKQSSFLRQKDGPVTPSSRTVTATERSTSSNNIIRSTPAAVTIPKPLINDSSNGNSGTAPSSVKPASKPATSMPQEPPGMWGPRNELKPRTTPSQAAGAATANVAAPASASMGRTQPGSSGAGGEGATPSSMIMARPQSGNERSSLTNVHDAPPNAGATSTPQIGSAFGSMNAPMLSRNNSGGLGSIVQPLPSGGQPSAVMGADGGSYTAFGPAPGSMYGAPSAYNAGAPSGGSLYGANTPGSAANGMPNGKISAMPDGVGNGTTGSMYGNQPGSAYGMGNGNQPGSAYGMLPGSMYGNQPGSMYGNQPGSMYGNQPGSMYGMGSIYGMGSMYNAWRPTSGYGFSAQWGSLANMQNGGSNLAKDGRSSAYGSMNDPNTQMTIDDICPVVGDYKSAPDVRRSGRRGGNHLYAHDKHDKAAPRTSNSQSVLMMIKRRKTTKEGASEDGDKHGTGSSTRTTPHSTSGGDGSRAKVPTNYNVHTLLVVDTNSSGSVVVTVQDANTVVCEKSGKKDKFECDEALEHDAADTPLDSVLLSELRGNWLSGHNSSLLVAAGHGKASVAAKHALLFVEKCVTRASSEKDTAGDFDVSVTMAALRGADLCRDVLKKDSKYEKAVLGSSPVYGPCLLDLTTKRVHDAKECVRVLRGGLDEAKSETEMVVAFLVLKRYKGSGSEKDVHIGSLCVVFAREEVSLLRDVKDKVSSAPYKLLRYAVGGASLTVSMLCVAQSDANARNGLEVERQLREIKNSAPRSGNVKRFIEYTEKEIARQKEKLQSSSDSEKKMRQSAIRRMEDMIADAKKMLSKPKDTAPKGYSMS